jgi:hypothetical protein
MILAGLNPGALPRFPFNLRVTKLNKRFIALIRPRVFY